jgi:hypothetical protein
MEVPGWNQGCDPFGSTFQLADRVELQLMQAVTVTAAMRRLREAQRWPSPAAELLVDGTAVAQAKRRAVVETCDGSSAPYASLHGSRPCFAFRAFFGNATETVAVQRDA